MRILQQRGERYRERMADVSEKVAGHLEAMDADEILLRSSQVEKITAQAQSAEESLVPLDKSAIQSVTPSQIYAWEGPGADVNLTPYSEARMPSEEKWYALTGRIVEAKVEADGDIHIALEDATGNNVGTVSTEIAVGPRWCEIRQGGWE